MLKNIAIPLMLAATEAEAQPSLEDRIEEAMRGDRAKFFEGLIAGEQDGDDCKRDNANDETLSAALLLVTNLDTEIEEKEGEISTLKAGDWKTADEDRDEAVGKAVDKELKEEIEGLLDNLDTAMEDTRQKAKDYYEAAHALKVGQDLVVSTKATYDALQQEFEELTAFKEKASTALENAKTQLTNEGKQRQWLYCELMTTENVKSAATTWWSDLVDDATITDAKRLQTEAADAPTSCTVPAIGSGENYNNDDDDATIERPKIKYYLVKGDLAEEKMPGDGTMWEMWSAEAKYQHAKTALTATADAGDFNGEARTQAGKVHYYTHELIRDKWRHMQRTKEEAFYERVIFYGDAGATLAENQKKEADYKPTPDEIAGDVGKSFTPALADTDGAAKVLAAAETARDADGTNGLTGADLATAAAKGWGYYTPLKRVVNGADASRTDWSIDAASITAWVTANEGNNDVTFTDASKTHVWWTAATAFSKALDDWYTYYRTNSNQVKVGEGARTIEAYHNGWDGTSAYVWGIRTAVTDVRVAVDTATKLTDGTTWVDKADATGAAGNREAWQCDTTDTAAWKVDSDAAITAIAGISDAATTLAGCLEHCEKVNADMVNTQAVGNRDTIPKWTAALTDPTATNDKIFCGAFSWDHTAATETDKCKLQISAADADLTAPTKAATWKSIDDRCVVLPDAYLIKEHYKAVANAFVAITDEMVNNMIADLDKQAALENSWLEAYFHQQYWNELYLELKDGGAAGSELKMMKDEYDYVVKTDAPADGLTKLGAKGTMDTTQSNLTGATTTLATLKAAAADADATRTELVKRIDRTDIEIAQLRELVSEFKEGSTTELKDGTEAGSLDEQLDKRTQQLTDFGTKHTTAKTAWEDAVKEAQAYVAPVEAVEAVEAQAEVPAVAEQQAVAASDGQPAIPYRAAQAAIPAVEAVEGVEAVEEVQAGPLETAVKDKKKLFDDAVEEQTLKQNALTAALTDADELTTLREAVTKKTEDWEIQNNKLVGLQGELKVLKDQRKEKEQALQDAILACQVTAFDEYRTALEEQMTTRANNLKKIKDLIKAEDENAPAMGAKDSRCEKALSNGTFRPRRGEQTCDEGLCCASSRVWMDAGAGADSIDAAWRTIETCQTADTQGAAMTYMYQPPRAPMATEMPEKVGYPYMCIEGAKQLAAAASALAAAVYMLA